MLNSHYSPEDEDYVSLNSTPDCELSAVNMKPGEFVKHKVRGGFGLLIANNDNFITILWSVEPRDYTDNFLRNLIHKLSSSTIRCSAISSVISVQPMNAPADFYLDYTYGEKKSE